MILPGFLSQNLQRDYPLKANPAAWTVSGQPVPLKRRWFVDLQLTYGIISQYDYSTPTNLTQIDCNGTTVVFYFTGVGNTITTYFRFAVPVNAPFGYVVNAEASELQNSDPDPSDATDPTFGFGFLQVGDLSSFSGQTVHWTGSTPVEPARVVSLYRRQVRRIKIGNEPVTPVKATCADAVQSIPGWKVTLGTGVRGSTGCQHETDNLTSDSTICYPGNPIEAILAAVSGSTTLTGCGNTLQTFKTQVSGKNVLNKAYRIELGHLNLETGGYTGKLWLEESYPNGAFDYKDRSWNLTLVPCTNEVPPTGIPPEELDYGIIPNGTLLTGDVGFVGGYYSTVDVSKGGGTAVIHVENNNEKAEERACRPVDKSSYPLGYVPIAQPTCGDLITSVNGIGPDPDSHVFGVQGSDGVIVSVSPGDPHALLVAIKQGASVEVKVPEECPTLPPEPPPPQNPDPPPGPTCAFTGTSDGEGGDEGYDQYFDMSPMILSNPVIDVEFAYQTYNIKDRVWVTTASNAVLLDSGCVGTQREVVSGFTVTSNMVPLRIRVTGSCAGSTGTGWYWRMGCAFPLPTINYDGCYTVRIGNGTLFDGNYLLKPSPSKTYWYSNGDKAVIKWFAGKWCLVITNGEKSLVYETEELGDGIPSADASNWVLIIQDQIPLPKPTLEIGKSTCPA